MRVAEVFSYGCRNMEQSLEWQLGALQKSTGYIADIQSTFNNETNIVDTSNLFMIFANDLIC